MKKKKQQSENKKVTLPASRSAKQISAAFFLISCITVFSLAVAAFTYDFYRGVHIKNILIDTVAAGKDVMHNYRQNKEIPSEKLFKLDVLKEQFCADTLCKGLKAPLRSAKIISDSDGIYFYIDLATDSPNVCTYLLTYDFKTENGFSASVDLSKENISQQENKPISTFSLPALDKEATSACSLGIDEYVMLSYKFTLN